MDEKKPFKIDVNAYDCTEGQCKSIHCSACGEECRTMKTSDSGTVAMCINQACPIIGEPKKVITEAKITGSLKV